MDVMAPDLGTDEQTMAWIMDTYSMKVGYACPEIVTGKPVELGGCVGRREATGRGVIYCILRGAEGAEHRARAKRPRSCRASATSARSPARSWHQRGVKIVAVGDRYGAIRNPQGIDIAGPDAARRRRASCCKDFPGAEPIDADDLLTTPCTVLVPAALERVITGDNAGKLQCRILAEGANGPTTPEADAILADSDIFIIPDVLCNAGGVTVSYFEWVQDIQQFLWSEEQVNEKLKELMLRAFQPGAQAGRASASLTIRTAALSLGVQKVAKEKMRRGLFP